MKLWTSLQISCKEVDAVKSARLKSKKMAIKIKNKNGKTGKIIIFKRTLHIARKKLIIKTSSFFYE